MPSCAGSFGATCLRVPAILLGALLAWVGCAPAALAMEGPLALPRFMTVGAGVIPRDVVPAIAQDREGYLWVATGDGLVRYDGYRFRPEQRESADPAARNLGWVVAMLAAPDGHVWIGTESDGLADYDPATDAISDHRPKPGPVPAVLSLARTPDGVIWAGTLGGGLLRFDPRGRSFQTIRSADAGSGLPDDRIAALYVDRAGSLWAGTWKGLVRMPAGARGFEPVADVGGASKSAGAPELVVQAIFQSTDGRLWIGTQAGEIWLSDAGGRRFEKLDPVSAAPGPAGAITSFVQTSEGELWVGRTDGIDIYDLASARLLQRVRPDSRQRNGLNGSHVTALLVDRAGSVWVAGFGTGLQRHPAGLSAIRMRGPDTGTSGGLTSADVRSILQRRDGAIWLAPHEGGIVEADRALRVVRRHRAAAPTERPLVVLAMCEDVDGTTWVGGSGVIRRLAPDGRVLQTIRHAGGDANHLSIGRDGTLWLAAVEGLYRLRPGTSQLERIGTGSGQPQIGQASMTAHGPDGTVWVATSSGLYRIAPGSGTLQLVAGAPGEELENPIVLSLLFDRRGQLWLDTAVAGLHRLVGWRDGRARFEHVSVRHGVFNRPFGVNLLEDRRGRLWTHMYVYDPARDSLHELTESDGVMFGTGWFRAYAALDDGRMLFGGAHGILVVDPGRFEIPSYAPPLVMSELRVDGKPRHLPGDGREIALQPGERNVAMEFTALDFNGTARQRYAFRLDGVDADWIEGGTEVRTASYGNLDPGRYTLRVRVANGDGVWSPRELEVPLHVNAAWWQTPWARLLAALSGLMLFLLVLRWRTLLLVRQRDELQRAVAQRTADLEQERASLEDRVRERTNELEAARNAAQAANRAKTSFLQTMSHEMRTPLNAILGLARLQLDEPAPATQQQRVKHLIGAAERLLDLINEVLDFSRAEAGQQQPEQLEFEVPQVLQTLQQMLAVQAEDKGLVWTVTWSTELEGRLLRGDRARLFGVLLNLAGNAVKFTERGFVRLDAVVTALDSEGVSMRFEVRDSGPGIDPEAIPRLFDAFERPQDATFASPARAGLGLAISRRWTQLMDGRIGVESTPGKGSLFRLEVRMASVPRAKSPSTSAPTSAPAPSASDDARLPAALPGRSLRGRRILLAEDDQPSALVATAILERAGAVVDHAADGLQAVEMAARGHHDVVLMDVQMPGMNGIEAARAIRAQEHDRRVPIVACTAFGFDEDRERCREAGMDDHLGKPYSPQELVAKVSSWLSPEGSVDG